MGPTRFATGLKSFPAALHKGKTVFWVKCTEASDEGLAADSTDSKAFRCEAIVAAWEATSSHVWEFMAENQNEWAGVSP